MSSPPRGAGREKQRVLNLKAAGEGKKGGKLFAWTQTQRKGRFQILTGGGSLAAAKGGGKRDKRGKDAPGCPKKGTSTIGIQSAGSD